MRALHWIASCLLLAVLIVGVGLIVAFVLAATSLVGLAVGASLTVLAWHGLRRIEPRRPEHRPPEGWPWALGGTAVYVAILLLGTWNPWLIVVAWVTFPIWLRFTRRR